MDGGLDRDNGPAPVLMFVVWRVFGRCRDSYSNPLINDGQHADDTCLAVCRKELCMCVFMHVQEDMKQNPGFGRRLSLTQ